METRNHREAWNKGKLVGQKAPLKPKDIWAIRIHLQNASCYYPGPLLPDDPQASPVPPAVDDILPPPRCGQVVRIGASVQFMALGDTSFTSGTKADADTLYRIYSMTKPITGMAAMKCIEDGLLALSLYDARSRGGNADGRIDASDAVFGRLAVWVDRDGDARTDQGELRSLDEANVSAIDIGRQLWVTRDGDTRAAVDLWFSYR